MDSLPPISKMETTIPNKAAVPKSVLVRIRARMTFLTKLQSWVTASPMVMTSDPPKIFLVNGVTFQFDHFEVKVLFMFSGRGEQMRVNRLGRVNKSAKRGGVRSTLASPN